MEAWACARACGGSQSELVGKGREEAHLAEDGRGVIGFAQALACSGAVDRPGWVDVARFVPLCFEPFLRLGC